jgi:hypothetical protein
MYRWVQEDAYKLRDLLQMSGSDPITHPITNQQLMLLPKDWDADAVRLSINEAISQQAFLQRCTRNGYLNHTQWARILTKAEKAKAEKAKAKAEKKPQPYKGDHWNEIAILKSETVSLQGVVAHQADRIKWLDGQVESLVRITGELTRRLNGRQPDLFDETKRVIAEAMSGI